MRIARTLFAITTPIGLCLGLREAWGIRPVLAVLMALLMLVVGGFYFLTWRVLRAERPPARHPARPPG